MAQLPSVDAGMMAHSTETETRLVIRDSLGLAQPW
jgi:hypothetical protein